MACGEIVQYLLAPVHGPQGNNLGTTWELVRNADSQARPRPMESEGAFSRDPGALYTC